MLMKLGLVSESHLVKRIKELKNSSTLSIQNKVLKKLPRVIIAKEKRRFANKGGM